MLMRNDPHTVDSAQPHSQSNIDWPSRSALAVNQARGEGNVVAGCYFQLAWYEANRKLIGPCGAVKKESQVCL